MSVFRIEKTNNYTVMSNYHLREREMSLKAKGLLSLMLSLPNDWDYTIEGLVSICKENISAVRATLTELKKFGYLEIVKKMPNETNTGRIEYEYMIYEKSKQECKKQDIENLYIENQDIENQGQLNTNKQNTKKINTNNIAVAEITKCYEENIGLMTPATAELLFDYLKDMDKDLIIQAIKIASINNKRTGRYVQGILNDWNKKGIKTLLDVENEQEKFKAKGNKKEKNYEQREYKDLSFLYSNKGG